MKMSRLLVLLSFCDGVWMATVGPVKAQTSNDLPGRSIVKLLPDYLRPRVYALNSGAHSGGAGSLVALNATNGTFLSEVPLGATPTDMDIDPSGQLLYVIHFGDNTISRVNLDSFAVTQTRSFPPPGNAGSHYNIKSGLGNRLYWLDAAWAPALHIMDFSSGTQVGTYDTGEGFGDLVFSPDKKDLYVWRQYGWHAGNINSWIWRLSVDNDLVAIEDTSAIGFYRDPLDSPILVPGNGDRVFHNHRILYTSNLLSEGLIFPNNDVIYSVTYFGDVAFSSTKAYNTRTGAILYNLPIPATVQAVAGDQQSLFLADAGAQRILTVPMSVIAPVPVAGLNPIPANGATTSLPVNQLAWTWPPGALSFQVYFGTDQAAVAAANTNSAAYRGTALSSSFALTNLLAAGATYYWRVDPVGLGVTTSGPVWSFQIAPIIVSPLAVQVTTIASFNGATQTLTITSGGVPQPWSLSEDIPWLSASATNGTTPATVTLGFQSSSLAVGSYTGAIQLGAGATTVPVPVSLEVVALDLAKMVTDYQRPYIYALQRSAAAGKPAAVVFINTGTEQIEQVLPILTDPRDLCVHPRENRLYIVDWLTGYLRVVDLNTRSPLPSLSVYAGLDRVNPGAAGRVIMEDWNQWVGVFAINTSVTTNGILPQLALLREGDGETSPDGRYYYHCDNNISSASAGKWDLANNGFVQIGGSSTSHPFGSRQLYLSPDGSRLFWQGFMYDTALSGAGNNVMQELAGFGQQIWASTSNAWFAIGDSSAFDTRSSAAIHNLGIQTSVKAFSRDDSKLFQFDPATKQLVVVPVSTILTPKITANPATQTVTMGATVNFAGASQGASPLTYQWLFNNAPLGGATNLNLLLINVQAAQAGSYALRVANPYGAATSAVATLTVVIPPALVQSPTNLTVRAGSTALFTAAATGTAPRYQWQFEGVDIIGATNNSLLISNAQAMAAGAYRVAAINLAGSATSASAILRVLPGAPQFTVQPSDMTADAGVTVGLTAAVQGSEPIVFQWYFAGAPRPGATDAWLLITNTQAIHAGSYYCVAANAYGTATSVVARLTVTPRVPSIVLQPAGRAVLAGSNALFTVGAQGTEPLTFQWRQNGSALAGATNVSLLLSNVQSVHAGNYDVVVANTLGSVTSLVASLTVNTPARITQLPANRIAMLGDSVIFSAGVEGTAPLFLQWQFNGTNLPGATNLSLELSNLTVAHSGPYRVTVANLFGNASAIATLSVLPRGGYVRGWGDNSAGQTDSPALGDLVRVAGGNFHSLAVRSDGSVVGWGDNARGQAAAPAGLSNVTAVAAGDGFSLALRANGTVTAWGDNSFGQTNVPAAATNIVAIAAGQAHAIGLRSAGSVVAWGNNAFGQGQAVANSDIVAIAAGEIHNLALRRNGLVIGWGNNSYGQSVPPAALNNVIAVSAGYLHSLALRSDGTVVAWGDNTFGQSAVPPGLSNVVAVTAGELHSAALLANGAVVMWGDDSFGQLDKPDSITNVLGLASGYYHQLAILPLPTLQHASTVQGLVLSWNGPFLLQRASSVSGPFSDLTTDTPWTNLWQNTTNSFFRLKRTP